MAAWMASLTWARPTRNLWGGLEFEDVFCVYPHREDFPGWEAGGTNAGGLLPLSWFVGQRS